MKALGYGGLRSGAGVTLSAGANLDAFQRLRVSTPTALFDTTFRYGLEPRLFENASTGNGVAAHVANEGAALLTVTAGAAGVAALQSYQYHHYNPGKSHQIVMTGTLNPTGATLGANQLAQMGYFDSLNGIFVELHASGVRLVQRSSVGGSTTDREVEQASWSEDPLDGSGPSGITIDFTKSQILFIDLQFLGVGLIRVGFDIGGEVRYAHHFENANIRAEMYMQLGTLPVRWSVEDPDGDGWAGTEAYCSAVASEGGVENDRGIPVSYGQQVGITTPQATDTLLLAVRPALTFNSIVNRILVRLEETGVYVSGNNPALVKVWYDATVTGGAWAAVDASDSCMEVNITATHAAGTGLVIGTYFVPSLTRSGVATSGVLSRLPIAINAAGTGRVGTISVTASGIGGASTAQGRISWREVR